MALPGGRPTRPSKSGAINIERYFTKRKTPRCKSRPTKTPSTACSWTGVRDLAAELPERQRTVFALRNFEGWPFAEIAARLGCSEESARASEYKALKKIRAHLGAGCKD